MSVYVCIYVYVCVCVYVCMHIIVFSVLTHITWNLTNNLDDF